MIIIRNIINLACIQYLIFLFQCMLRSTCHSLHEFIHIVSNNNNNQHKCQRIWNWRRQTTTRSDVTLSMALNLEDASNQASQASRFILHQCTEIIVGTYFFSVCHHKKIGISWQHKIVIKRSADARDHLWMSLYSE